MTFFNDLFYRFCQPADKFLQNRYFVEQFVEFPCKNCLCTLPRQSTPSAVKVPRGKTPPVTRLSLKDMEAGPVTGHPM